ncbi:MAG: hypothetical protein ABR615_06835 [Pseudonocardiaceae bacterium]
MELARVIATAQAQTVLTSPPPDADDVLTLREIVTDLARLRRQPVSGQPDARSGRGTSSLLPK